MCQLFDSLVRPIITYGCEVWWASNPVNCRPAESLHRSFLKRIAGLPRNTLTAAVHGEYGRFPLELTMQHLSAKYYQHLASLDDSRIAKQALLEALQLEQQWQQRKQQPRHRTCLQPVQQRLSALGIPAETPEQLAAMHSNSIRAAAEQQWLSTWQQSLNSSSGGSGSDGVPSGDDGEDSQRTAYGKLKVGFACEAYLQHDNIPAKHRSATARVRTGYLAQLAARAADAADQLRREHTPCLSCGDPYSHRSNRIYFCDHCDAAWHSLCLPTPVPKPAPRHWFCPDCVSQNKLAPVALQTTLSQRPLDKLCPHCSVPLDGLPHLLFSCPVFSQLRQQYTDLFDARTFSSERFFAINDPARLSSFLFHCLQLLQTPLSQHITCSSPTP
jgi:hypothetical protein